MPGKPYFGPERRKSEFDSDMGELRYQDRRSLSGYVRKPENDRRAYDERREEAQAGVIVNMSGEDMLVLKQLHEKYESQGPVAKAAMLSMTYEDIIAREA